MGLTKRLRVCPTASNSADSEAIKQVPFYLCKGSRMTNFKVNQIKGRPFHMKVTLGRLMVAA